MIRSVGGNSDHPDSIKFPYLFKLLSTYSLLKPPKGSNVSNDEMFSTFCDLTKTNKVLKDDNEKLTAHHIWQLAMDHGAGAFEGDLQAYDRILNEFDNEDRQTVECFAGYVAKEATKFTSCETCLLSLRRDKCNDETLLSKRDHYNVLVAPALSLPKLLLYLEKIINEVIDGTLANLLPDTFFTIFRKVDCHMVLSISSAESIGCLAHRETLMCKIVHFYILTRLNFIIRDAKKELNSEKCRELKKKAKLV